ncbi:isocitrate lyase/PEP mutase family protein [Dongia deserti]|uniref:isocitrate lyase/PEP mutase family protein n=1 Tax=Dongia deserti TaxID=2268030 RepID=UPI000E652092|nr:isocitrate lyase/phosphoenolpyruvate mutase family protein [Dongia deserti]
MSAKLESAATFHQLHEGPEPLLLPNAWDAGSARLMESLGAKAVATTSAGVAWTHGYPDGNALPVRLLLSTVATIARAIRVPLSIDLEGGYSDDPSVVEETVAKAIEAGAVGINMEDGSNPPDLLCLKIERAVRAGEHFDVDLFVNARTDVYLRGLVPAGKRVAETLERARFYRNAGASGLFVPGLRDAEEIRAIAAEAGLPLNVMAWPGLPAAADLARLGVRRLSAGSGVAQALWGKAAALATDFLKSGKSDPLGEGAMGYADINALFEQR